MRNEIPNFLILTGVVFIIIGIILLVLGPGGIKWRLPGEINK